MAAFWPPGTLGAVVRRGEDGLEQDVRGIASVHCRTLTLASRFSGYNGGQWCSFAQNGQQGVDQALAPSIRLVEEGMWDQGRAPWFAKEVFT
jgi:hypothetical protein